MEISAEFEDFFGALRVGSDPADQSGFESEESRLIRLAVGADEAAFEALIRLHQESIFRFCIRWLHDVEDAREATQDTFVNAFLAIKRYRPNAKFSTWLYRIALNQCRDRLKSKQNRNRSFTDSLSEADYHACQRPSPDQAVEQSNEREALLKAIDDLPEKFRAVVILCGVEEVSQAECAEILKISIRAVEGRFYRARKILAGRLWIAKE